MLTARVYDKGGKCLTTLTNNENKIGVGIGKASFSSTPLTTIMRYTEIPANRSSALASSISRVDNVASGRESIVEIYVCVQPQKETAERRPVRGRGAVPTTTVTTTIIMIIIIIINYSYCY